MIKKKNIFYFFFILLIFLVDRISKVLIIRLSNTTENQEIIVSKFLSLNLIWNKGIAFGIFSFDEKFFYNILTMIIIIVTLVVFWLMVKAENLEKYGFMIIFSGSLGNVYDRLVYSSVPDFIDFHFNEIHWFIFNFADIFITIGVICLVYDEIFLEKKI